MKTFKKFIYWFLGIVALLVIVSFLLPKNYKVERSVTIASKTSLLYTLTSNFELWHVWVPWTREADSSAVFTIQGEPGKVGTSWEWEGKVFGNGRMVLTETTPGQGIAYDLAFDHGKYQSKGRIILESRADSVKVSWLDEGNLGWSPINRYFGLFMDRMMGPDFEKGLAKLKTIAEARRDWPAVDETVYPERKVIMVTDSAGPKDYGSVMARAFGELYGFLQSHKLKPDGDAFATYLRWDSVTYFSVMNICVPVAGEVAGAGRVRFATIPETRYARAVYFGDYAKIEPAYRALEIYIKEAGRTEIGGPSELYKTSPVIEKDTAKWETHVLFPIR